MNIEGQIRELGPIDITALSDTILAQEENAWHEDHYRQETFDVHRQTETISLVFTKNRHNFRHKTENALLKKSKPKKLMWKQCTKQDQ